MFATVFNKMEYLARRILLLDTYISPFSKNWGRWRISYDIYPIHVRLAWIKVIFYVLWWKEMKTKRKKSFSSSKWIIYHFPNNIRNLLQSNIWLIFLFISFWTLQFCRGFCVSFSLIGKRYFVLHFIGI